MAGFENEYYEQALLWEQDFWSIPEEKERIERTIALIPQDAHTLLDVGCGNGSFLNSLPDKFKAIGLDSSKEALRHVRTEAVYGDIADLPFEDDSFDVVTCLEVLEHLPSAVFERALDEIQRVSKKYIIISVPNREGLDYHLVKCPQCSCWYHPYRHLREFERDTLKGLFNHFTLCCIEEIGPFVQNPTYDKYVFAAYRSLKSSPPPKTAVCPQCGLRGEEIVKPRGKIDRNNNMPFLWKTKFTLIGLRLIKLFANIIWRPQLRRKWLLTLYIINKPDACHENS